MDEDHLGLEVIDLVGPGGRLLTDGHTMEHFGKDLRVPKLMYRSHYENWAKGVKKTPKRAERRKNELHFAVSSADAD